MFEGLFAPVHLLILAVVVFIVMGPRKIASRFEYAKEQLRHLVDDDTNAAGQPEAAREETSDIRAPAAPSPSGAYRFGRHVRRRHLKT